METRNTDQRVPGDPTQPGDHPEAGAEEPPFYLADGVMDLARAPELGLESIRCEAVELFRARPGASFSHHPGLAVFQDHLHCSWSAGEEAEDRPRQCVMVSRSADGRNWSAPVALIAPTKEDRCVAAGFLATEDTLTAYFTLVRDYPVHNLRHPETALFAMTSRDGKTWGEPRRVTEGFFIEGPLRLPSGRLLIGGEHTGVFDEHRVRMRMLHTDDPDGLTGWEPATIHPEMARPKGLRIFDYTEPCPFIRRDGAVVVPFRNYSGHLYASVSHDGGANWSVPVETNFPDSMARCNSGRLPDGTNYLINNPGPGRGNRQSLVLSLSPDGVKFDRSWLLHGEPTAMRFAGKDKVNGWQYPCSRVWKGRLFVACSVNKEDILVHDIALADLAAGR